MNTSSQYEASIKHSWLTKLVILFVAVAFSVALGASYSYAAETDQIISDAVSSIEQDTEGDTPGSSDEGSSASGSGQDTAGDKTNDQTTGTTDNTTEETDGSADSGSEEQTAAIPVPKKAGWLQSADGTWYYFTSASSAPKTGWLKSGSKWYYLDPAESGALKTGIFTVAGKSYIADSKGALYQSCWVKLGDDWYYASTSGVLKTGWFKSGGKWYWLAPNDQGKMAKNCWGTDKDGKQYYLSSSGAMANGWIKNDSTWYYTNPSGAKKVNGWVKSNGKWYWLSSKDNGAMSTNAWVTDKNKQYYLGATGAMAKGWIQNGSTWYYADSSGAKKLSGWVKSTGKWYWLCGDQNGAMASEAVLPINGKTYSFGKDGAMLTRAKVDLENGDYGHTAPSGEVIKIGAYDEDGNVILRSSNGEPLTGWQKLAGYWFYGEPETGVMQTGWLELGGKKYYLDASGAMATGTRTIDDKSYYFNHNGVMTNRPYANAAASAKLVAAANSLPYQGNGYCAKWTNYVYVRAGYAHPDGNACDLYWKYCTISNLDLIEPGMILAVPSHTRSALGSKYGHVAIYMGNGMVRHNTNKLETVPLSSWLAYYQTTYPVKCGWAFPKK